MRTRRHVLSLATLLYVAVPAHADEAMVRGLLAGEAYRTAVAHLRADHARFVRELIELTEVPAPPFAEASRGRVFAGLLEASDLDALEIDAVGNVLGLRQGTEGGRTLAVVAHLDTVFPPGTEVTVRREGTRLMAPGVQDNAAGLAALLAVARALSAADVRTRADLLFVASVGEEAAGNLRGVRYLLREGRYRAQIDRFIAVEAGAQTSIVTGALGSHRLRARFLGPGGHSYAAYGLVNPALAMGGAIQALGTLLVPQVPRTSFNVGVVRGGTSVNAIPAEVSMDLDLRSESPRELRRLIGWVRTLLRNAVDEENRARSTARGPISLAVEVIGERPAGATPPDAAIVRRATAAFEAFGLRPRYVTASTDANVPIGMGVPAITIGSGTPGGRSHSLEEWIDVTPATTLRGLQVVLTTILAVAELPPREPQ